MTGSAGQICVDTLEMDRKIVDLCWHVLYWLTDGMAVSVHNGRGCSVKFGSVNVCIGIIE